MYQTRRTGNRSHEQSTAALSPTITAGLPPSNRPVGPASAGIRVAAMPRGGQPPGRGRLPRRNRRGLIGMLLTIVVAVVIVIAIFAAYNQVTGLV